MKPSPEVLILPLLRDGIHQTIAALEGDHSFTDPRCLSTESNFDKATCFWLLSLRFAINMHLCKLCLELELTF